MELASVLDKASAPRGMPTKVIAIDGCGGAGKTVLAEHIAAAMGGSPIVHTDDFASWDDPLDWWPRVVSEVLGPVSRGDPVRYHPHDWATGQMADTVSIDPPTGFLLLEGVSAMRLAFEPYLAFRIWVHARAETRLRRGLARDGKAMEQQWLRWMAEEDAYSFREKPIERADLIVSGEPSIAHDSEREIVILT